MITQPQNRALTLGHGGLRTRVDKPKLKLLSLAWTAPCPAPWRYWPKCKVITSQLDMQHCSPLAFLTSLAGYRCLRKMVISSLYDGLIVSIMGNRVSKSTFTGANPILVWFFTLQVATEVKKKKPVGYGPRAAAPRKRRQVLIPRRLHQFYAYARPCGFLNNL